jgi:hypothetical protein
MIEISISSHRFVKVNIMTIVRGRKAYDKYRCMDCGLEGKRYGLSDLISVRRDKRCSGVAKKHVCIMTGSLESSFGLMADKVYPVCTCPEEKKEKYAKDVWVFSEKAGEPVRLLVGEYYFVETGGAG